MAENEKIKDEALPEDYLLTRDFYPSKPLPEGVYGFTVEACILRDFPETERFNACKGAVVTILFSSDDGKQSRRCKKWFRFTKSYEPRLCGFLRSVGLKKVGEPLNISEFSSCLGLRGRALFKITEDGKYNDVRYFLDPVSGESVSEYNVPAVDVYDDGEDELSEDDIKEMHEWFGDRQ
ncbi:MAG: hypothetical protein LUD29_04020 [Clostridia bacterium]|nr:hypothetical protein [Clostridia bacterium]